MWRYWRQGQTAVRSPGCCCAGTLPGVIAGSVIRVYLLLGPVVFDFVVAPVLIRWASGSHSPRRPSHHHWQGTAARPSS